MFYLLTSDLEQYNVNSLFISGIIIAVLIAIAFYVLRSIGVYTMAKKAGKNKPWLAFIPFAWIYTASTLSKNYTLFGRPTKRFALYMTIVFCVAEAIGIAYSVVTYFPLAGYYLSGENVYYIEGSYYPNYMIQYPFTSFCTEKYAMSYVYNGAYQTVMSIIGRLRTVINIVEIFFIISLYFSIFRDYAPERYWLASILSVFGLFPIFVFIFRNRTPINYEEYLRARFNMYNNPYGNPYNGQNNYNYNSTQKREEPYSDFGGQDNGKYNDTPKESPFGEFPDDKNN
ncbi:MAG: hypothetical protein IJQ87_00150 [Clostridia bacterium]|nr:hypothetical protein [Clostridia bacterium]